MPKFEVAKNVRYPFLSKVTISLKSAALSNSTDVQKRLNSKWDVEKRLYDDIAASTSNPNDAKKIEELRYVLHQIATQVRNFHCFLNFFQNDDSS